MIPVPEICRNCGGYTGKYKPMKDPTPDDTTIGLHITPMECIAYLRRRLEDIETRLKIIAPDFVPNRPPLPGGGEKS